MPSEATNLKRPASSPVSREEKKTKEEECLICTKPATDNIRVCMLWEASTASCSKLRNEQCKVIAKLTTSNIVFFCSSCIQVFTVALKYYDSQSVIDSKVSTSEKSFSEIQLIETKLSKIMKNVEAQKCIRKQ